jgi:GNAT superfamily N-acetyltransferase
VPANLTVEQFPLGDRRVREFAYFPWRLYRGDPYWTPPLMADLLGDKLLGTVGVLTPEHPYHSHSEVTHFIARRGGEIVGTVSAAEDHRFNAHYGSRIGNFGFFECTDDVEVARALLDSAGEWCSARGMEVMRGPGQYGNATHERQGVLVWGFEHSPTVELTHNPPYYAALLESCGFYKAKDYLAYTLDIQQPMPPRLFQIAEAVRKREGARVVTRPADMSRFRDEVRLVIDIYNQAWSANWGFLPITQPEADALAESLRPIVDPGLVRFAFVDGEPAAVLGALPDPYLAIRPRWKWYGDSDAVRVARLLAQRRHLSRVRLMFFGIVDKYRRLGVDALLFSEVWPYARQKGYRECETSMLLEDNDLVLRANNLAGGHHYKTWRIYETALG